MKNKEIIFEKVRELANDYGVSVTKVWETDSEFICIDVDDLSVPYGYLMNLDNYLSQWDMIVISVDINLLTESVDKKELTIWIG